MRLPENLILEQFELGPLQNFLYFIGDKSTKEIAVIDPAWDVDFLIKQAAQKGYKITYVFLTHGHPDHVNGLDALLKKFDVPVYISKHEAAFYTPRCKNLIKNEKDAVLKVGTIEFNCLYTPGHTPGCQCFQYKDALITGDLVFIDGCGRCDLPGGDASIMYDSLYNVLMKLPDSTTIFPGHNYGPTPYATLASQKKTNHYLTCESKEEFLEQRMGLF